MGTTPCASWCRSVLVLTFSLTLTLSVAEPAQAEPDSAPRSVAALVAEVAEANQKLQRVGARVQAQQESVNKAIVEVQDARDAAAAAQQQVDTSEQAVKDAAAQIALAQKRFDTFAASTYINGPSASLVMARTPDDIISTATALQTLTLSAQQAMADLKQAHAEAATRDAAAQLAKQNADQSVQQAQASQDAAVVALTEAQTNFREQQAEIDQLAAERRAAQQKLQAAQSWSAPEAASDQTGTVTTGGTPRTGAPARPASADRWNPAAAGSGGAPGAKTPPYGKASEWDLSLPMVPSAFASGDPVQIINAVLAIAQNSFQTTQSLGKQFLQKLGILKPTDTGINNGAIPMVYGNQAIEYVIKRGQSQIGVPYSWGGGTASGPSRGIDDGANTVGFDCSGLVMYAFAGAGVKIPHYSGSQYTAGRQVPSAQMRRGDVIFYGPNGSQHEALYLGNGQMLEAPYTGSDVHISAVRTSGMTPYVVRFIE